MNQPTWPTPLHAGLGAATARRGDRVNGCRLCGDPATYELNDGRHGPQRACEHHLQRLSVAWAQLGWRPVTITAIAAQERAA